MRRPEIREPKFWETYTEVLDVMPDVALADDVPWYVCLGFGPITALVVTIGICGFHKLFG